MELRAISEEQERVYQAAAVGDRLGYGDAPALLIVDLQKGETDPDGAMGWDLSPVIDRVNDLVGIAHDNELPVVWTRVAFEHPSAEDASLWQEKLPGVTEFVQGSVGAELDDRLAVDRETDLVLDRQRANPFYATQLDSYLTARGVDTVVICGATTSGCIRSTADGALAHGYRGIIPYGTVDDRSTASHNAHLWDIDMKVADVRPFDEVAAYLAEPTDT